MRFFCLAAALITGCNLSEPVGLDGADQEGGEGDADHLTDADEAERDTDMDGGGMGGPGPLTFVVNERGMTGERRCDLDGDGDLDNAIADLGLPGAEIFASVVSVVMQANIDTSIDPNRDLVHFPWLAETTVPESPSATVILVKGADDDDPPDVTDDFSGDERYFAQWRQLDPCGEPLIYSEGVAIEEGLFSGRIESYTVEMTNDFFVLENVLVHGTFRNVGGRLEHSMYLCGATTATSLGDAMPGTAEAPDLSALELLLSGGAPFGAPSLPGLSPDLDLDGDGLERFVIDADGFVERCIDGDSTTIEGRECSRDDRIADGFSLVLSVTAVPAIYVGREPGWEGLVEGTCDEPPEVSLWDAR